MTIRILLLMGGCLLSWAEGPASSSEPDPAHALLTQAYADLQARNYDGAIANFRQALAQAPERVAARKDLAYTLLKIGANEAARDEFGEIFRRDPAELHAALEYGFLCHETRKPAEAHRVFEKLRQAADPAVRGTAQTAFENIDRPLREGIARWKQVVEQDGENFSAHEELARLAEQRGELGLAIAHYERAWRMRPARRDLLVVLGQCLLETRQTERAMAVLIAAAWGAEPRAGEQAREKLPRRYPYLYEFRAAQMFDPDNARLAREIGYLLLAMGQRKEAEQEFARVLQLTPSDETAARQLAELQGRSLPAPTPAAPRESSQVRQLALASYERSYLQDALKYLRLSLELEPDDSLLQLRLAQTLNLLQRDREAMQWYAKARKSKSETVAREADAAWRRLHPQYALMQNTTWAFPFFSTRWRDGFGYAQSKTEFKLGQSRLRPYLSTRFVGDTGRGERYNGALPAQLSETSVIFGGGAFLPLRDNFYTWGEAGVALRYLGQHPEGGRARPDYRGGAGWFRGWGKLLGAPSSGRFAETNADAVFVSRFQRNTLLISQTRAGYSFARKEDQKIEWQALWNFNVHTDARRQYWANFVETGPGLQFRWQGLPPNLRFGIHGLRGVYLRNAGNPLRPNFFDLRVGFWYAITR